MYCKILVSDPKLIQKRVAAEIWKNFAGLCQIWKTAEVNPTWAAFCFLHTVFSLQQSKKYRGLFFVRDYFTK